MTPPVVALTGTSGTVGSSFADFFRSKGWQVREFSRSARPNSVPFVLGKDVSEESFKGVDALIHCAYDFNAYTWSQIEKTNILPSIQIFKAAKKAGVKKLIFISSISAFEECVSLYGKGKLSVEKQLAGMGVSIVRPGLVWGPSFKGIFGNLARLMWTLPVVPLVGFGSSELYLVHEEDLARFVYALATKMEDPGSLPLTVAHPEPVKFSELLKMLGRIKNKRPIFIPVPYFLALWGLKILEMFGFRPRMKSDGLIGLFNLNPNPDFSAIQRAGTSIRKFSVDGLRSPL